MKSGKISKVKMKQTFDAAYVEASGNVADNDLVHAAYKIANSKLSFTAKMDMYDQLSNRYLLSGEENKFLQTAREYSASYFNNKATPSSDEVIRSKLETLISKANRIENRDSLSHYVNANSKANTEEQPLAVKQEATEYAPKFSFANIRQAISSGLEAVANRAISPIRNLGTAGSVGLAIVATGIGLALASPYVGKQNKAVYDTHTPVAGSEFSGTKEDYMKAVDQTIDTNQKIVHPQPKEYAKFAKGTTALGYTTGTVVMNGMLSNNIPSKTMAYSGKIVESPISSLKSGESIPVAPSYPAIPAKTGVINGKPVSESNPNQTTGYTRTPAYTRASDLPSNTTLINGKVKIPFPFVGSIPSTFSHVRKLLAPGKPNQTTGYTDAIINTIKSKLSKGNMSYNDVEVNPDILLQSGMQPGMYFNGVEVKPLVLDSRNNFEGPKVKSYASNGKPVYLGDGNGNEYTMSKTRFFRQN